MEKCFLTRRIRERAIISPLFPGSAGHRFFCPGGCGGSGTPPLPPPPPNAGPPAANGCLNCIDRPPPPSPAPTPVRVGGGGGTKTGAHPCMTGCVGGSHTPVEKKSPPPCDATCQAETQAYNAAAAHFESIANMLNWSTNRQLNLIISAILTPFSWLVGGIVGGILTALSAWVDMAKTIAQGFRDELKYGVSWFTALNVIGDRTRILSNIGSGMFQELAGDVGVAIAGLLTAATSGAVSDGLAVPVEVIGMALFTGGVTAAVLTTGGDLVLYNQAQDYLNTEINAAP